MKSSIRLVREFMVVVRFIAIFLPHIVESRGVTVQQKQSAHQEKRFALVIGNINYKFSPLRNPVNDAKGIARTLHDLGFEVAEKTDLTQKEMKIAINNFGKKSRGAA